MAVGLVQYYVPDTERCEPPHFCLDRVWRNLGSIILLLSSIELLMMMMVVVATFSTTIIILTDTIVVNIVVGSFCTSVITYVV